MPVKQGSLELLQHPASKELLKSTIPARLAYVWTAALRELFRSGFIGMSESLCWGRHRKHRS